MNDLYSVSVVIPAYNCAETVGQAVDSCLSQDIPVIIYCIDDGSTDDLEGALKPYLDMDCFHYVKNEKNMGVSKTRMRGVEMADTEYIAFLDADDWWAEGKLEKQLKLMKSTNAALTSTGRELMTHDGKSTGRIIGIDEVIDSKKILLTNCLNCSGVMVRRDAMLRFPMEHDDSHEDYISWIKIINEFGPARGINEPLLKYRLSHGGKSRNKLKSAVMNYKVYRYCGFGRLKSLALNVSYAFNGVKKYYL